MRAQRAAGRGGVVCGQCRAAVFRAWLDFDAARGFDELYADLIAAGAPSIAEAWAPKIAMYVAFGLLWLGLTVWGVRAAVCTHRKWRRLKNEQLIHE